MRNPQAPSASRKQTWVVVALLSALMLFFFWQSLVPELVQFSNDGPLGAQKVNWGHLPQAFTGTWADLNVIGSSAGSFPMGVAALLRWALGPVGFAKFFVPLILLGLGLGAWFFYRRLGLCFAAACLGAIATMLSSDFFSNACWGVGSQVVAAALDLVAMGLVLSYSEKTSLLRRTAQLVLAGFCVGIGVVEAADVGAIFSLMVAGFVFYDALTHGGSVAKRFSWGVGRTAVLGICAGLIAINTVYSLVNTQIKGVAGTEQDAQTKAQRWDFATQWSMPKKEALGLVVPGLFGYRMDSPHGGAYWGSIGADPGWEAFDASRDAQAVRPIGTRRFSGSGAYLGVSVALVVVWTLLQSLRRKGQSVFSPEDRKRIWFWGVVLVVSLVLSFGRYAAPFYHLVYALPYFSTIRNPIKFLYPLSFAAVILFAYGLNGLWQTYIAAPATAALGLGDRFKKWWARAAAFDKRWVLGCVAVAILAGLSWAIYSGSRQSLCEHLQGIGFEDPSLAQSLADHSVRQAALFVVFFLLSAGWLALALCGAFSGGNGRWPALLLGVLLVADLGLALQPWIKYWDYQQKYATNPIIDMLRDKPYEHRVAILPRWFEALQLPRELQQAEQYLEQVYGIEWAQHHFYYYNVQSLDIVQQPRTPVDLMAFEKALNVDFNPEGFQKTLYHAGRRWQLTNTRYLLGAMGFLDFLNEQFDPGQHRFRVAARFDLVPKPGIAQPRSLEDLTAVLSPEGSFALYDFTGALPRARLYSSWQVSASEQQTLDTLASKSFDPWAKVLVTEPITPASGAVSNAPDASVELVSYATKNLVFHTKASTPTVLLLNDRYDENWKVMVDGQPARLLHCNYLMRGVQLSAGEHRVQFRFLPPIGPFYVSVAAIVLGVMLVGFLAVTGRTPAPSAEIAAPQKPSKTSVPKR